MPRLSGIRKALPLARQVKRQTGKPILRQFSEMLRLRAGRGKLMPDEYFSFGLFDDHRFDPAAKPAFIGQWAKDTFYRANKLEWRAVGNDKLISYLLFSGMGLTYPEVKAVYHPTRTYPARTLRTPTELEDYLRSEAPYPLFAKPVDGGSAWSAFLLRGYDAPGDQVQLGNGKALTVPEFIAQCTSWKAGMLFQELIDPHRDIANLCGPRVSTMRLFVLNGDEGPYLHRAVLRMPVGGNMYDNFKGGASGNLLAALDDDGRIVRVIVGASGGVAEVDRHPDTGRPLIGFRVPDWDKAVSDCLGAAAAFPGLRIQAWDVAPSSNGPLFVELNTRGDLDLVQLAHRTGIADARWNKTLLAFLR